jgi:SAM-dependent methyltransferase
MNNIEKQRCHFDSIADKYYNARQNPNNLLIKSLIWSSFFKRFPKLNKDNPLKVLEPMCGYGEGRKIILEHLNQDIEYSGFDYSARIIEIIKEKEPQLNVVMEDACRYIPKSDYYDLIIIIGGLHHVYSHADIVVKQLASGLRKGGYILAFEPTQNCWLTRSARNFIYKKNSLFDYETEQAFELNEYRHLFESNDLKLIDEMYPGLLSYILYYNPDAFPKLNIGGSFLVKAFFFLDKFFYLGPIGRKFSFATILLAKKPEGA